MSDEAKPAAWAVIGDNYEYATLLAEHAGAVAEEEGGIVVPLYRSPTLTDAERGAVESCIADDEAATAYTRAATLRGLLERTQTVEKRQERNGLRVTEPMPSDPAGRGSVT